MYNITFHNVTPSLISRNPRKQMCSIKNLLPCCHISLSYIMGFYIELIHQRIQTTRLHASRCHRCCFCSADFVYSIISHTTNSLLSCIHANTTDLFNIICSLVATSVVLGRLEYLITNTQQSPRKATLTGRTCFTWISLQHHGQWNFVASTDLLVFLDCWKQEQ